MLIIVGVTNYLLEGQHFSGQTPWGRTLKINQMSVKHYFLFILESSHGSDSTLGVTYVFSHPPGGQVVLDNSDVMTWFIRPLSL